MSRLRLLLAAFLTFTVALPARPESGELPRGFEQSKNPHIQKWAYALLASRWPSSTIYVCWENSFGSK